MSKTIDLEAAIKQDLEGITQANGYQTDVRRIYTRPVQKTAIETPCIAYSAAGGGKEGSSDQITIGPGSSEAVDRWRLELLVQQAEFDAAIQRLKDDVRNALEKPTSAIRTLAGVERVDVTEWSEVLTSETIGGQFAGILATVEVLYIYRKGGL